MWLIFEGGELVGKTTLAKEFASLPGYEYFRGTEQGRPPDLTDTEAWERYDRKEMEFLESLIDKNVENLVLDRVVWISDMVYGKIFRNYPDWRLFERGKSWNIRMAIIYCYCPFFAKIDRGEEEKFELDYEMDGKIKEKYLNLLPLLIPRPVIRVNTRNSIFDCRKALMDFIEYRGWL